MRRKQQEQARLQARLKEEARRRAKAAGPRVVSSAQARQCLQDTRNGIRNKCSFSVHVRGFCKGGPPEKDELPLPGGLRRRQFLEHDARRGPGAIEAVRVKRRLDGRLPTTLLRLFRVVGREMELLRRGKRRERSVTCAGSGSPLIRGCAAPSPGAPRPGAAQEDARISAEERRSRCSRMQSRDQASSRLRRLWQSRSSSSLPERRRRMRSRAIPGGSASGGGPALTA